MNGKGSRSRVNDYGAYREQYDQIFKGTTANRARKDLYEAIEEAKSAHRRPPAMSEMSVAKRLRHPARKVR